MPKKLRIKRRKTGAAGPPSTLANAEIAFNEVSDVLYYGKGGIDATAAQIIPIAGSGAYVDLISAQTINGAKTFSSAVTFVSTAVAPTPATVDNSTLVATTAFVKNQQYLTAASTIDGGVLTAPGSVSTLVTAENGQPLYTEILGALNIE
jgi:hypothetical protein